MLNTTIEIPGQGKSEEVLSVEALQKCFRGRTVVDTVSFSAESGEIFSLLGPNGAGKTTTIRMVYGSLKPDGGRIGYFGKDFVRFRRELKMCIGVCSQNDTLDYDLTVRSNLEVFGRYYHMDGVAAGRKADELMDRFELTGFAEYRPRELSGGWKRRLQIARALVNRPRVLFLDEPTVGLDPHVRREIWHLLHRLRMEGVTVILTTHYMEEAETLSDRVLILDEGRTIETGVPAEMIDRHFSGWLLQIDESADSAAILEAEGVSFDRAYGRLTVHADEETVHGLTARFRGIPVIRRRPNLEDLFVHLTGRGL